MSTRRMAGDVNAVRIPAEAFGMVMNPRNRALERLHDRHDHASSALHTAEIECNEMRPCIDEHRGEKSVVLGVPHMPAPAMQEDMYRRVRAAGPIEVKLFVLAIAVVEPARLPDDRARILAQRFEALEQVPHVWGVLARIVLEIQLVLI